MPAYFSPAPGLGLAIKQSELPADPPAVTARNPVASHHPVAWNRQCDRVRRACPGNGEPDRIPLSAGPAPRRRHPSLFGDFPNPHFPSFYRPALSFSCTAIRRSIPCYWADAPPHLCHRASSQSAASVPQDLAPGAEKVVTIITVHASTSRKGVNSVPDSMIRVCRRQ